MEPTHKFKITIYGGTAKEAARKVKALAELARILPAEDIEAALNILKKDPAAAEFLKHHMGS